jgi:hypothetical protein
MKIKLIVLIAFFMIVLRQNGALLFIPGTNADGSNNYAVSIGNDDCYVTFQTGDYFGVVSSCELFYNPPKTQGPILPSFPRADGIL